MIAKVSDVLSRAAATTAESYRNVKIVDFQGNEPLEFDTYIYLPLRGKHIRYTHAGKELAPEQVARLKNHDVSSLQIKQADMPKFYQFTAMQLMMLGKDNAMSATERQEKLQSSVRAVVSDIFSQTDETAGFDSGRKIIGDCQEIVKSYISAQNNNHGSLYDKITAIANDGEGTYSKSTNIATFSALFAIGLGLTNAEEIAMAGLLCDVGLSELPAEIQAKEAHERTPTEEAQYRQHPELSIKLLKAKRIIASEKVFTYIKQHHENYDGTGYPQKLAGDRISIEAQILGLAVDFTELLLVKPGQKRLTPKEAMEHIVSTQSGKRFSTSLMSRVNRLLFGDSTKNSAA
jgi:HD-GYP domain-containing protein (c-di-GMP phosphodiesterase class II)